ncbi:MAG: putative membrane protein YdjX (TVP38/TMEM64 family) [Arcticibacterium sp.]
MKKYLSIPILSSLLLIIVPLVATSFLSIYFVTNESYFTTFDTSEWIGFSLISVLTQAFALTPPTFVALVLGYFWGWKTLPVLFLVNMGSIFIINRVVLRLDSAGLITFLSKNKRAAVLLDSIKKDELKIIGLAKLSPILPFTFTNFIFTLSGAKLKNILLGGFLGMIPRTVMSVWAGTQAKEIKKLLDDPNANNNQQIMVIALILISAFGLIYIIGKAVNRSKEKS